jgi:hypothetical protein
MSLRRIEFWDGLELEVEIRGYDDSGALLGVDVGLIFFYLLSDYPPIIIK